LAIQRCVYLSKNWCHLQVSEDPIARILGVDDMWDVGASSTLRLAAGMSSALGSSIWLETLKPRLRSQTNTWLVFWTYGLTGQSKSNATSQTPCSDTRRRGVCYWQFGEIDLVTATEVIEIKFVKRWTHALVVSFTGCEVDARLVTLHFFGQSEDFIRILDHTLLYDDFHVEITYEVVNWSVWVEFTQLVWRACTQSFTEHYVWPNISLKAKATKRALSVVSLINEWGLVQSDRRRRVHFGRIDLKAAHSIWYISRNGGWSRCSKPYITSNVVTSFV
jgi:hypothetical protein